MQRFIWCLLNIENNFENYIFVDESMIRSLEIPLYHSRLPAKYPDYCGSSKKYTTKINIFGAISYRGASRFVVIYNQKENKASFF